MFISSEAESTYTSPTSEDLFCDLAKIAFEGNWHRNVDALIEDVTKITTAYIALFAPKKEEDEVEPE